MDAEETKIITTFISTWAWQILAVIFLTSGLILYSIPRTLVTFALSLVSFLLFIICEFFSFARKRTLEENNE